MTCTSSGYSVVGVSRVSHDETHLWLPPGRLRLYAWARVIGALLFVIIFSGWILIRWSNPAMGYFAGILVLITLMVTTRSLLIDRRRAKGRQIILGAGLMIIRTHDCWVEVKLDDISHARWMESHPSVSGLWLFNRIGESIAHVDREFLADQSEARAFLRWFRCRTSRSFKVQWPEPKQDVRHRTTVAADEVSRTDCFKSKRQD